VDDLPSGVTTVVAAFVDGLKEIVGEALVGVYLYGALTFPETHGNVQDIDFHVIASRSLEDEQRRRIADLRPALAREFGDLAEELDGYVILRDDMRSTAPPRHQMWPLSRLPVDAAWALHCAHIRAGHVITAYGPDPRDLYPEPGWPDLRAALFGEVRFVDEHVGDAPAYCVLNAVRILYGFTTRDVVVSKVRAAEWGLENLPVDRRDLIRTALRDYAGDATDEDGRLLAREVGGFVGYTWQRVGALPSAQ